MPTVISRDEALARIRTEGGSPACLMCAVRERTVGPTYAVYEDADILVLLPRYVRRWGHIVVMPQAHITTYTGIDHALWARVNHDALHAAKMLERVCSPLRIYVTSTGSSAGELTQTSMHLHIHVIPLYDNHDRPADVFSWQGGVTVAEHHEWEALRSTYAREWAHGFMTSSGSPAGSYAPSAAVSVASAVGVG